MTVDYPGGRSGKVLGQLVFREAFYPYGPKIVGEPLHSIDIFLDSLVLWAHSEDGFP